jgi:hypothetical protein
VHSAEEQGVSERTTFEVEAEPESIPNHRYALIALLSLAAHAIPWGWAWRADDAGSGGQLADRGAAAVPAGAGSVSAPGSGLASRVPARAADRSDRFRARLRGETIGVNGGE